MHYTFLSEDPGEIPPGPAPASRAGQLTARRRETKDDVLGFLATKGRTPSVVLYAATEPGEDVGPDLAACNAYAVAQGWKVTGHHFDDTGRTTPLVERTGWRQVRASISAAFAHGVITINRQALAMTDDAYAQVLGVLDGHRAFLDFPPVPGVSR
jgi:hypothetical protein